MATLRNNSGSVSGLKKLAVRKSKRGEIRDPIELSVQSSYESVEAVAAVSRSVSGGLGFGDDVCGWIELAVREAVINAIKHGNKQADDKPVDVRFVGGKEGLTVYIRDRGDGFDDAALPDPLNPQNLLKPEGRGIFFMRAFMDEVEFSQHPEGGSIVRMLKLKKETA